MKTLLVTLEYPPQVGGMEAFYGKLAEHWPEEMQVIDNQRGRLVSGSWLPGLWTGFKAWRAEPADWVLAGDVLPVGIIVWLLSFMLPFRYAVFLHGLDFVLAVSKKRKRWLTGRILSRASAIIAVNGYTAAQVKELFPEIAAKISIVNPGAEVEYAPDAAAEARLRQNYGLEDAFLLLTIGRLVKRKGADMVLRALPIALKEIPELRYAIIGQGPAEQYLKDLIAELGLQEKVVMLSGLDTRAKNTWLAVCDAFIMPARNIAGDYEGFGIVYLEANLLAKPVIAGWSGGVGDAVIDGLNGLRVNEEAPAEIAAAIIRLYRDASLRQSLGEQGRQRAEAFSWKTQTEKIFAILKSIH